MSILTGLHGVTAIALICLLLFVEESGVPIPLLSGDVLLVLAGVLIVNGSISPWEFFPPAFAAELAGVMTAHFWSRTIGQRALEALADKVRARKALDRTAARLSTAGPLHITVARLVPGLRINTSLVAGAMGVSPGTFLLGVTPAIIIWLAAYTLLGVVVGVPVLASLNHVQHVAVTGVVLILIGVVTLVGLRYIPPGQQFDCGLVRAPRMVLAGLSVVIDIAVAATLASGTIELLRAWLSNGPDSAISLALIIGAVVLIYVAATRRLVGGTAGERLTSVRYNSA